MQNLGICHKCNQIVPARHETREERVYLVKDCPSAARRGARFVRRAALEESATSVATTKTKRGPAVWMYGVQSRKGAFACFPGCDEPLQHELPDLSRQRPIDGLSVRSSNGILRADFLGARSHEPRRRSTLRGEPTVRNDLIDIIKLAKRHGLSARVVTNGLRMADEDYCKRLLATGTQLMFAFDGRDPKSIARFARARGARPQTRGARQRPQAPPVEGYDHVLRRPGRERRQDGRYDSVLSRTPRFYRRARLDSLSRDVGTEAIDAGNTTIDDVERMIRRRSRGRFHPGGTALQTRESSKDIQCRAPNLWRSPSQLRKRDGPGVRRRGIPSARVT